MQISPGNAQAARGQRLVPVVLPHRIRCELYLVVAKLALERSLGIVFADVDDLVRMHAQRQILGADRLMGCENDRPLNRIFQLAHVAGPG